MSFGRRLRSAFSKLDCRRPPRSATPPATTQSLRPWSSKASSEEAAPPRPPIARSRPYSEIRASTPPLALPISESGNVKRQSTIPDLEPANEAYSMSSSEREEGMLGEDGNNFAQERPLTAMSTASSDYSNHSISHSISPSTPVPPTGRTLMGSLLIDTPPPTPPDSEYPDPTWGGGLRGPKVAPPIPQLPVLKRRSSAPDTLLVEGALGRLKISSRGYACASDYDQFTPDDSPISDQLAHEIPTTTTNLETNFSKPFTHTIICPREAEQEYPPTNHLKTPMREVVRPMDEETALGNQSEGWRGGEMVTAAEGNRRKVDSGFANGVGEYLVEGESFADGDRTVSLQWVG